MSNKIGTEVGNSLIIAGRNKGWMDGRTDGETPGRYPSKPK